jgi:hypothetical protein
MLKKSLILAFSLMSYLATSYANNQPTSSTQQWYQIEMIMFSQIPYGEKQNEIWPLLPALSLPSQYNSLVPPNIYQLQRQNNYPLVAEKDFLLGTEGAHIFNNPNYQMIGHLAWLQPLSTQTTTPSYIQAANNQSSIDALISLKYKRFVQLNLQSMITINAGAFSHGFTQLKSLNNNGVVRFALNKSIRMKMNELNYIDSPFLGILIKVTPHAAPVSASVNDSTDGSTKP